ncbi:Notchless protein-like [Vitis vinifera]|uniref:Notchless protein-like n=1 Tax=Vitis vinifera TaxID=29760 RepID=A0A438IUJ6_VITVI|nr:Notchless protein-like [Vitis vinifera]
MTEEKMEALVAISTYLMFGSKRALIRLQIAAWHHRKRETASDRDVVTTRKVEEHFPRHVQGLGWRKSSRNFAGKAVWRADRDKNPQKRYVQGLGWEKPGAPLWCGRLSEKDVAVGKFAGDECFLTTIQLTRKYWEMGKVIGMKHGHRKICNFGAMFKRHVPKIEVMVQKLGKGFRVALERYKKMKGNAPERLVSGSDDFTMFLWEPADSKHPKTRMTGHQQVVA